MRNFNLRSLLGTMIRLWRSTTRPSVLTTLRSSVGLSILLLVTTCCRGDNGHIHRSIDPELVPYIVEFEQEMTKRGVILGRVPLSVQWGNLEGGYAGKCYLVGGYGFVSIHELYKGDEYQTKATIMHELSHCHALVGEHSPYVSSLMYYSTVDRDYVQWTWEQQLDELAVHIKRYSPLHRAVKREY